MRKITITSIAFLIILHGQLNAQNISSALGCIKTDFQFYSDTIDLDVTSQFILKNAGIFKESRSSEYTGGGWGYGYGGGYESYHLEFITDKDLSTRVNKSVNYKYEISFVDSINVILATITFDDDKVLHYSNRLIKNPPNFYSFDLINTPVSVLDRTRKIYITEIIPR